MENCNVKHPETHVALNDADKKPVSDPSDNRLDFLIDFAGVIKKMPGNSGGSRKKSLTSTTRDSLSQTVNGLVSLTKELLREGECKFVLLGVFQTDPLEGEFGIYCQSSGGNYYISFEQILNCASMRRMKLFNRLAVEEEILAMYKEHPVRECCSLVISDDELRMIDEIYSAVDSVDENELQSLFYVCGYITLKEGLVTEKTSEYTVSCSNFTHLVSRGKLSYPQESLFHFAVLTYAFFKKSPDKYSCSRQLENIFLFVHDSFNFEIPHVENVCRRLCNVYFKGLVTLTDDLLKTDKDMSTCRRKRKLSNLP